ACTCDEGAALSLRLAEHAGPRRWQGLRINGCITLPEHHLPHILFAHEAHEDGVHVCRERLFLAPSQPAKSDLGQPVIEGIDGDYFRGFSSPSPPSVSSAGRPPLVRMTRYFVTGAT